VSEADHRNPCLPQEELELLRSIWGPFGVEKEVVNLCYRESRDKLAAAHKMLCEMQGATIPLEAPEDNSAGATLYCGHP